MEKLNVSGIKKFTVILVQELVLWDDLTTSSG